MPSTRTAAPATYSLQLGGTDCGDVKSISGGGISAPVVEGDVGADGFRSKHIGPPTYEEFVIEVGLASAPDLYAWIASAWTPSPQRRDGAVVTLDANRTPKSERQFMDALITEVTVPALDGSSKDAARLTLKFRPRLTHTQPGSAKATTLAKPAKKWLASNFRLDLDGIDTSHVVKIESFTVTHAVAADPVGIEREPTLEPAALEFPNLVVTIPQDRAQAWETWFQDFVVDGNNDASKEKSGSLVFLGPDLQAELGRVVLHSVGICALWPVSVEVHAEQIARVAVELYCERMELQVGAHAPGPAPVPPVVPTPPVVPIRPIPAPTPIVPRT